MSTPPDRWSSGARSRWRGSRVHLTPHWRPAARPPARPRTNRAAIRAIRIEPPATNGAGKH